MTEPMGENLKQTRLCCPVVEWRQYTLHPGKRDVLIEGRKYWSCHPPAGRYCASDFATRQTDEMGNKKPKFERVIW